MGWFDASYHKGGTFLSGPIVLGVSHLWRAIWMIKRTLHEYMVWELGEGTNVLVAGEP
jgi:hypothetical protein